MTPMIYITTISLMGAFIAFCLGVIAYLLRTSFTVGGLLREMILRMSNLEKAVLNGHRHIGQHVGGDGDGNHDNRILGACRILRLK